MPSLSTIDRVLTQYGHAALGSKLWTLPDWQKDRVIRAFDTGMIMGEASAVRWAVDELERKS